MDQFKHYLRIVKRQHFWALSVLIVLLGIGAWFMTVNSLGGQRIEFQSAIDSSYSTVASVSNQADHVNQDTEEKMTQLIAARREEVRNAWKAKYEQQTGGEGGQNILKWPDELGQNFIRAVEKFQPIEKKATYPVEGADRDIPQHFRAQYRDYVEQELPKLAERIGAVWPVGDEFGGFRGGGGGEERGGYGSDRSERDSATIVYWDPEDQQFIQSQHFDWTTGRIKLPSSLQVLYAQEDLWVLTALVDIIKRTNGTATVRHNAAIKEIESIRIGKNVGGLRGKVTMSSNLPGVDDEGGGSEPEEDWQDREESGEQEGDGPIQVDPAEGRYVDKNYQQLGGFEELRGLTSEVAKRMPVRMRVRMDQRAINKLLAECANSPLTVEVRQVRINPDSGATSGSAGLRGGLLGGYSEDGESEGPGGLLGGQRGTAGEAGTDDAFPYDVMTEVYGIIYIYNPVDEGTLGEGADTDASVASR